MPKFVPVTNPEIPRSEQNLLSKELIKHRKWDNPHAIINADDNRNLDRPNYLSKYNHRDPNPPKYRNVIDEYDYKTPKKRKLKNTTPGRREEVDEGNKKRMASDNGSDSKIRKIHRDKRDDCPQRGVESRVNN